MEHHRKWALNLSRNIRSIRSTRRMRQSDLAQKSGINLRYYQNIESGRANITLEMISRIADGLGVSSTAIADLNDLYVDCTLEKLIAKLDQTFDEDSSAVFFCNQRHQIIYTNNAFNRLLGLSAIELQNRDFQGLVCQEDRVYLSKDGWIISDLPGRATLRLLDHRNKSLPVNIRSLNVKIAKQNISLGYLLLVDPKLKGDQLDNFHLRAISLL